MKKAKKKYGALISAAEGLQKQLEGGRLWLGNKCWK
jgi:hypothetical protein